MSIMRSATALRWTLRFSAWRGYPRTCFKPTTSASFSNSIRLRPNDAPRQATRARVQAVLVGRPRNRSSNLLPT